MFDPQVYRSVCRELVVSGDKMEEMITMAKINQSKKLRRPLKIALVTAAAMALMVVGVGAAAPEALQGLALRIATVVKVDEFRQDLITEEGVTITTLEVPEATLEDRGGRAILVVGEDEVDITETLATEGRYVYEKTTGGTSLTVTVEGSVDRWEIEVAIGTETDGEYGSVTYTSADKDALSGTFSNAPIWRSEVDEGAGNDTAARNAETAPEP